MTLLAPTETTLRLEGLAAGKAARPLDRLTIRCSPPSGTLRIQDPLGRTYLDQPAAATTAFDVAAAPGTHLIELLDDDQRPIAQLRFRVDARTRIEDSTGRYARLLTLLYRTMIAYGDSKQVFWNGRIYHFFVQWLRDHVHTLKGMKYFHAGDAAALQSAIELYRDSQRDDGMIFDNIHPRHPGQANMWDARFEYGGFIRVVEGGRYDIKRIPVENDVEYLYIEGIYYTWKATGDDAWMHALLDSAIRAMDYSRADKWRWSAKFGLLKRGYTIDTWDFQNHFDAAIGNKTADPMVITDQTQFGVMFGDNTGYAQSCDYLARMLDHAGRAEEAERFRALGAEIRQRLDAIAWNGRHFTHHVRENPTNIDLGVDESSQVSLSNAYSLNRGIAREQAEAIIRTYQSIRASLPQGSPGEWYTIYPPFEHGYGAHNAKWQYMNGGVTPIVAGELARGAFMYGHEAYGIDILARLLDLGTRTGNHLHCTYTGAADTPSPRTLTPIDLAAHCNTDFDGTSRSDRPADVMPWTGEGDNDLHEMPPGQHEYAGIPFTVADPATNRRRGCIGLSASTGYLQRVELPMDRAIGSIYLLHTKAGTDGVAGQVVWQYTDGTSATQNILEGKHVSGWWVPAAADTRNTEHGPQSKGRFSMCLGWQGRNAHCPRVGMVVAGLNNPQPGRTVRSIALIASPAGGMWFIAGLTTSDAPVRFPPSPISYGIPDNWGAAAVVYALIEGLCGIVDDGTRFSHATVAPRWAAADAASATVCIAYPSTDAAIAYRWQHDAASRTIDLTVSTSGDAVDLRVLLPAGADSASATLDGEAAQPRIERVRESTYACFTITTPLSRVRITYA
jgi:hypothetical protein